MRDSGGQRSAVVRVIVLASLSLACALACAGVTGASRLSPRINSVRRDVPAENALLLRRGAVDTLRTPSTIGDRRGESEGTELRVVQFAHAVSDADRDLAHGADVEVLAPVPTNGLLVRGRADALDRFAALAGIRWQGMFGGLERLDPSLDPAISGDDGVVDVAIEVVADRRGLQLAEAIAQSSLRLLQPLVNLGGFAVVRVTLPVERIRELLESPDVVNVEPVRLVEPLDERAGIVAAGLVDASHAKPLAPGYLEWLASHGFDGSTFDFGIEFPDSGFDTGLLDSPSMHPAFRAPDGSSRAEFAVKYTVGSNPDPGDFYGHGSLNTSIAAGYADAAEGNLDADGYRYGLGVAPYARIGSSKIFDSGASIILNTPYTNIATFAYRNRMRISSNSWGAAANSYTVESQEYDRIVRDADPETPGNQQYSVLFAAGNAYGGGTINTPATAKNVITVGATEGYRPEGIVDGCGVGDDGADSVDDVIDFSSGGPLADGRVKPDIVAPGTHIIGAASQHRFYNGMGLCVDTMGGKYYPYGQTLYAWASGTSQATPVVAGAAALVREYMVKNAELPDAAPPSPAMIKATLLAATTPIEGKFAGRTLPDVRQGYGRVNLAPVFDDAARSLVDQTVVFANAGESRTIEGDVGDPLRPFRVALVWTDAPGLPNFAPQVNDLDLEVRVGDAVYRGNAYSGFESEADTSIAFDRLNNTETVTLPAGVRGHFTVTVRAASISGDGVPGNGDPTDQDFALVIYNVDDGRWSGPPPPEITNVTAKRRNGFKLLVFGNLFTATSGVEVNGVAVEPSRVRFVESKSQLKVRGSASSLHLVPGANVIVVTQADARSADYNFNFTP